ncbi:MAG: carboxypeptidase-like regulatory domain-containing protein, partial [Prevotella salivae]|nr:carboxypeptidase-like regulatory domain-containing protein [Segatella salivae]
MNNRKLIKGTLLPIAVACLALTFSPLSILQARAAVGSLQQTSSIRGTIVDEDGEPIIGATVLVINGGKTQGTVSDFNGIFVINVKPGTKLKITFIGLKDEIIEAKNGMKVVMKSNGAVNLKAVEVVAYGVQKKVTVTGALSSVKGGDLVRTPVSSVNNILAGQ